MYAISNRHMLSNCMKKQFHKIVIVYNQTAKYLFKKYLVFSRNKNGQKICKGYQNKL